MDCFSFVLELVPGKGTVEEPDRRRVGDIDETLVHRLVFQPVYACGRRHDREHSADTRDSRREPPPQ